MNRPLHPRTIHPRIPGLLTLILLTAAAAQAMPTLEISPTTIEAGDPVTITFDGFEPGGYEGTINIDGEPAATIFIPASGGASNTWTTPVDIAVGGRDIDICAACGQGDLEERTNSVRVTVVSSDLEGSDYNLQPWAIEVTQGVRGPVFTRTPPIGDLVFPPEDVVHVANRRTIVRVYPWVEGGPDFDRVFNVRAHLWVTVDGTTYGPLEAASPLVWQVRADATMDDLRGDLRRTWNFVLPPEATQLDIGEPAGNFDLFVDINPDVPGQSPECESCFDDNGAYLSGNEFQHVGRNDAFAFKFRPHLMECEVEQEDGSINMVPRPTIAQLVSTVSSLHEILPIADGRRGVRLMPWRNVDWSGTQDEWDPVQDAFLFENYLPGGELHAGPPNDLYAFLYWGGGPNCSGHAFTFTPFLRSSACGGPTYVGAHEANHAIGASHAGNGHEEAAGGGYDTSYPGEHGQVEDGTWGINVYSLRLYPPRVSVPGDDDRHDLMSYGPNKWMSLYTWNLCTENLGSPEVGVHKQGLPAILAEPDGRDVLDNVAFRGVMGRAGQVDLAPFFASYPPNQIQGDGAFALEFYDPNNGLLAGQDLQVAVAQDLVDYPEVFATAVALPVGWAEMRLVASGQVIQTWQRSANPPQATITSPSPGFQLPNTGQTTVTWTGVDGDGDPMTYRILGLHGTDGELFTLAAGLTDTSFDLDLGSLPSGGDWTLIVEVSDGFDRTYSQFVSGHVEATPPLALILQPSDESVHVAGGAIPASGTFTDLQGDIADGNTAWYLDGVYLGFGSSIDLTQVSAGEHELQFVVYNALQLEGSSTVSFTVVDSLEAPALLAPADGAVAVSSPVTLSWTAVPGAVSYRVQASLTGDFTNVESDGEAGNIEGTSITFGPGEEGQTIYWRAMAEHGTSPSAYSAVSSFTMVGGATPVEDVPPARDLALSVFPNPFNPNTTVSFVLPHAGEVTLAVYDLAGRRVRMLGRGYYPAGEHQASWDGRDGRGLMAGSGVYLVRLQAGDGVISRRVMLLK